MDNKKDALKSNIIFSFISQIITYLIPFVLSPYLARILLPEGNGEYSFGYSIVYYFTIIVIFGFTNYGIRQISSKRDIKDKYSKYFWNIYFTRLVFFIISTAIYIVLVKTTFFSSKVRNSIYYALILVMVGEAIDLTFLFQGLEKFKLISIINVLVNLLYLILVFCFVKSIDDLLIYTILKSSIKIGLTLILAIFAVKLISKPVISKELIFEVLKGSSLFFLPSLVMHISPIVDQTMLGFLTDNSEVGYYQQVYKIISLVASLVFALGPIMLSKMSYLHKNKDDNEILDKITKLIKIAFFIMLPATVGLFCIAKFFIPAYFGDKYINAINVMYLFLPGIIFGSISSLIINGYYYPAKKVINCTLIMFFTVILNAITNIFAIKYYGACGAAFTSSLTSLINMLLLIIFSKKSINYRIVFSSSLKIYLSSLVMGIVLIGLNLMLNQFNLNNILICVSDIVVGCFIYIIMLWLLKEEFVLHFINILFKKKGL